MAKADCVYITPPTNTPVDTTRRRFLAVAASFEIYSDAALTRSEFSRPAPDPATTAVAHALKRG
jgi:hypothetical protein